MSIQYVPFQGSGSSVLPPNQTMSPGQYLISPNGRFRLELQGDGNLVIKDHGVVAWIANINQPYSKTLHQKRMVGAPRFFVSNSGFLSDPSRSRLWIAESTHTRDKSVWYNSFMALQDDGNLIIYDNRTGHLCWARFGFVPGRLPGPKMHKFSFESDQYPIWKFDIW